MRRWLLTLLLLPALSFAEGPKYGHSDSNEAQEFENVYNDLRKIFNREISSMSVTNFNATNSTFSFVHASTGTFDRLDMLNGKIINLANGTASTDATAFGQINYGLQKSSQTSINSQATTTSATFQPYGPLKVTITPTSASSRIKVTVSTLAAPDNPAATDIRVTLNRGATDLGGSTGGFGIGNNSGFTQVAFTYIDSPATTSATTYQVYFRSSAAGNNGTIGRNDTTQTIIAEEIR